MDSSSLVTEEIDAGAEFIRRLEAQAPVKVAFWLKSADDENHYLCVAPEHFDGSMASYEQVVRIAGSMRSPWFDTSRVKLIRPDRPLAKAASDIKQQLIALLPIRLGNTLLGDVFADDIYLYAPTAPATVP
jgi:hypothetical protein